MFEDKYRKELEKYSKDADKKLDDVLKHRNDILKKAKTGALKKKFAKVKLLLLAVKDYANGSYREIPWGTIAAIVGALFYIFVPFDLIPDWIPLGGLTDDAAVLALAWSMIQEDIKLYAKWKIEKGDEEVKKLYEEAFQLLD